MAKHSEIRIGLGTILGAVETRRQINELYEQYRALSSAAQFSAKIEHSDFKRAVDALHYLGGGWPSENSKGRMEALLDSFSGMYRVLHFIGRGRLVEKHLALSGITVTLAPESQIQNVELTEQDITFLNREYNVAVFGIEQPKDLQALIRDLVNTCEMIQGDICQLADSCKDALKDAERSLGAEKEEVMRLRDIIKFSTGDGDRDQDRADKVKRDSTLSLHVFNQALGLVAEVTRPD